MVAEEEKSQPDAAGSRQSQVTQVAPVCRGFWVKPGAPYLGAPPPFAGMPQSLRQAERRAALSSDPGLSVPRADSWAPQAQSGPQPYPRHVASWGLGTKASFLGRRAHPHSSAGFSGKQADGLKPENVGELLPGQQRSRAQGRPAPAARRCPGRRPAKTRRREGLSSPECLTKRPSFSDLDLS